MAAPATPNNLYVQAGNRQVYLSWDITAGATSYDVYRSTDGVNFGTSYASVSVNNYLDTGVTVGTLYYYKISASNGSGESPKTSAQQIIPAPTAEMSLGQIRLLAQQRADRVNSNFVTLPEWNSYINQSMYELYDLLITADEEYYVATPAQFTASPNNNQTYLYPLPDGATSFTNGINGAPGYIAPPFYKLKGVDLGLNTANNAWVSVNKFNFADRNKFVYPNTASTIYGVFNLQYRMVGSNIEFIPTPSSGQQLRIWYIPRLPQLLQDTDLTTSSISGWIEYVIVDAAIKALQKEESDVSILLAQKEALRIRIEGAAANRDTGQPDRVSDIRPYGYGGGYGGNYGWNGGMGGY